MYDPQDFEKQNEQPEQPGASPDPNASINNSPANSSEHTANDSGHPLPPNEQRETRDRQSNQDVHGATDAYQPGPSAQGTPGGYQPDPYGQGTPGGYQPDPYGQGTSGGYQPGPYGQGTPGGYQPAPYGQGTPGGHQPDPYGQGTPGGYQPGPYGQGTPGGYQSNPNGPGAPGSYNSWGAPPPPPEPMNGPALASFIIGCVSLLCGFFPSIAAVITGIVALMQYRTKPYPNRWMAITGLVMGGIQFVLMILFLAFGIFVEILDL